jgi:Cu/Ag efflux protein CusF
MRKVLVTLIFTVVVAFLVAGPGLCQQAAKQPQTKETMPPANPQGKQIVGDVVKVDGKAKTVVVKTASGEKKFDIANAALAGYNSIGDMKSGDKLAVLYEEKNGKLIAKAVANHSAMTKMQGQPK